MLIAKFLDPITQDEICEMKFESISKFYDLKNLVMLGLDMNPSDPRCADFISNDDQYPELKLWCSKLEKIYHPNDDPVKSNYHLMDYITELYIVGYYDDKMFKIIELIESNSEPQSSSSSSSDGSLSALAGGESSITGGSGSL